MLSGEKKKERNIKKIKKICGDDKWLRRKSGEKFPPLFDPFR